MKVVHWIIAVAVTVTCLWVITMTLLPLFIDGNVYHIHQPVEVVSVEVDTVVLQFSRYAAFNMAGNCVYELQCGLLYQFPDRPCPLEQGERVFKMSYTLPEVAKGMCEYRGTVMYSPAGVLGPQLTYLWRSESFEVK